MQRKRRQQEGQAEIPFGQLQPPAPPKPVLRKPPLELDLGTGGKLHYAHEPERPVSNEVAGLVRKLLALEWAIHEHSPDLHVRGGFQRPLGRALARGGYKGELLRAAYRLFYYNLHGKVHAGPVNLKEQTLEILAESARHHLEESLAAELHHELAAHLEEQPSYKGHGALPYYNRYMLHLAHIARQELERLTGEYRKHSPLLVRMEVPRLAGEAEFKLVDVLERASPQRMAVEPPAGAVNVPALLAVGVRRMCSPLAPPGTHTHELLTDSREPLAKSQRALRELLEREFGKG